MKRWSLLKRIIWLFRLGIIGVSSVLKTIIGNPIHILDALAKPVQALSIALEPIQDLHGYDNPWPAGGGKNKFDKSTVTENSYINSGGSTSGSSGWAVSDYIVASENTTYTLSGSGATGTAAYTGFYDASKGVISTVVNTQTTFTTPSGTAYIRISLLSANIDTTQLEIGSTASAWTPYSNLCPIYGHTSADVTRTGVNVWDEEWEVGNIDSTTGQNTSGNFVRSKNYISVAPNEEYYINTHGYIIVVYRYDANKNFLGTNNRTDATLTIPSDTRYIRFRTGTAYGTTYNNDISINYPSTDHDYHAYTGTTYPIPLGTTVYGGTLDVLTGVLTVTHKYVNAEDVSWSNTGTNGIYHVYSDKKQDVNTAIADYFAAITYSSSNRVAWADDSPRADKLAAINNGDVHICYELATPQTIQLTPQQVELLQGENNIWSDGEMTLVYLADGNASDIEALNILLGGRYVNNHEADEPTDREALDIVLGGQR